MHDLQGRILCVHDCSGAPEIFLTPANLSIMRIYNILTAVSN